MTDLKLTKLATIAHAYDTARPQLSPQQRRLTITLATNIRQGLAELDVPITADSLSAFSAGATSIASITPGGSTHIPAISLAIACLAGQLLRGEI